MSIVVVSPAVLIGYLLDKHHNGMLVVSAEEIMEWADTHHGGSIKYEVDEERGNIIVTNIHMSEEEAKEGRAQMIEELGLDPEDFQP